MYSHRFFGCHELARTASGTGREGKVRVPIRHLTACVVVTSVVVLAAAPVLNEPLTGRQVFPVNNWWNEDITTAPVDTRSAQLIDWISGRTATNPSAVRRLHPDFGPPPYGFPYVVVSGDQARVPLTFVAYGDESDAGAPGLPGYPIPEEAKTKIRSSSPILCYAC